MGTKRRFSLAMFLLAAAAVSTITSLFAQELSFAPGVNYSVGDEPQQAAIADLNGDGIPDIAVTNSASNTISILLGRGGGTFSAAPPVSVTAPLWIAAADLNDDGIPDLALTTAVSPSITVLFGNGDGTFRPPVTISVGEDATGIAVGDLNGDGKADLVVTNSFSSNRGYITILLNKGRGEFQAQAPILVGSLPAFPVVADFDGCGRLDIAMTNQGLQTPGMEGSVAVLHNRGDGTFAPPKYYAAGHSPLALVVGDFNRDGWLDIAVAASLSGKHGSVAVLLGNGDGSFQPPRFYSSGGSPVKLAVADFNGDGNPDLAVANTHNGGTGAGSFTVLLGSGDGSFQPPQYLQRKVSATGISAGDLNGDGKPDIVGVNFDLAAITVFLNTTR